MSDSKAEFCLDLYVSLEGNDQWSGLLAEPDKGKQDGPKRSLKGAAQEIAMRKKAGRLSGPVRVRVRGGRYFLSTTLSFGPEHSWPTVYESYPGEEAIFDGGSKIENWKISKLNGLKVWEADVASLLDAKGRFRQLFVNGKRAAPARSPKKGFYWMEDVKGLDPKKPRGGKEWGAQDFGQDSFVSSLGDFDKSWKNLEDLEVVVMHYWLNARLGVKSFDPVSRTVQLKGKSIFPLLDSSSGKFAKYFVENLVEALSEPGEWALDTGKGKLYYVPRRGEKIESSETFVSHLQQLLKIEGDPDKGNYAEHLSFRKLSFEHADCGVPVNSKQSECNLAGNLVLEGARYISFDSCRFEHLGCYAMQLKDGCSQNRIVGCEMKDLGAGGIIANGSDAEGSLARRTGKNRFTDNSISAGGRVFSSACGIITMHSGGNQISHNLIHDFFYSGISVGWVWGYAESVSKENRIEKNHIYDLGKGVLSDMGGIYTLGVQPGTRIAGNLIHDIEKANYGGWAIYPDEGSSHIVIENNVCYNVSSSPFHQHYGRENLVVNNIFAFGAECICALTAGCLRNTGYTHCGTNFRRSISFYRNIFLGNAVPIYSGGYKVPDKDFDSDLNLIWDVSGKELVANNSPCWNEWKKSGYDSNSIVADPKFKDPKNGDFTLGDDSPASKIGFSPIDISDIGPRPEEKRVMD
ncbi:MAG: hypothetical protein A2X49_07460 [Lentisphaerae bacterium GWF2_52_8]|nr:MAG: hypothetical protein A2X49_07460 [Lentisphaerae bacterium GWF2_52_8]